MFCEVCGQPSNGFGSISRDGGVFCSNECKTRLPECEHCDWPVVEPFPVISFMDTDKVFCCEKCRDEWEADKAGDRFSDICERGGYASPSIAEAYELAKAGKLDRC